jgi:drug/metabolite transporter (DMT)-like permease
MKDALLQSTFLSMGQFLNFLIFSVRLYWISRKSVDHFTKYRNKALRKGKVILLTEINLQVHNMSGFKIIHLAFLGVVNSIIQMICLRYLPLSFYQIMQAIIIIFIPILARIFLNKTLYRYWINSKTYIHGNGSDSSGNSECCYCLFYPWQTGQWG